MEDYYQILGISPRATQLEVRRSFRKLAVLYHPDKNKTAGGEERFKEINQAYSILGNPERRALYDLSITHGYSSSANSTTKQPTHRDPAYRRRRAPYAQSTSARQNIQDLMQEYLPKFRWVCYIALVVTTAMALDYSLPYNNLKEDIVEINRIYRTGRGGGMIYDHDELITRSGIIIRLQDTDLPYFKDVDYVKIQQTLLFRKNVRASIPSEKYSISVAAIYGNLFFVPVILFISALLGVIIRNSVEFPFNLSIVCFILLIIVTFLLTR